MTTYPGINQWGLAQRFLEIAGIPVIANDALGVGEIYMVGDQTKPGGVCRIIVHPSELQTGEAVIVIPPHGKRLLPDGEWARPNLKTMQRYQ